MRQAKIRRPLTAEQRELAANYYRYALKLANKWNASRGLRGPSASDAVDAAVDGLMHAVATVNTSRPDAVTAWVRMHVTYYMMDSAKLARRRNEMLRNTRFVPKPRSTPFDETERSVDFADTVAAIRSKIRQAIQSPLDRREIFDLFMVQGHTIKETAKLLGEDRVFRTNADIARLRDQIQGPARGVLRKEGVTV